MIRLLAFLCSMIFCFSVTYADEKSPVIVTNSSGGEIPSKVRLSCRTAVTTIKKKAIGVYQLSMDAYNKLEQQDEIHRKKKKVEDDKAWELLRQGKKVSDTWNTRKAPSPGTTKFVSSSLKSWFNQEAMAKFESGLDLDCDEQGHIVEESRGHVSISKEVFMVTQSLTACCRSEGENGLVIGLFRAPLEVEAKPLEELGLETVADIQLKQR